MTGDKKYFTGYRDVTEDGAFGYKLPDELLHPLERSFLAVVEQVQHSTSLLVSSSIMEWSSKLGMTPAQWLEIYEPEVSLKPWQPGKDSVTLKLSVTAKART